MLQRTNGIVLRSIKYGDTSLVTTIFTATYGVQTYMVQGVRTAKSKQNKAVFFQPGMLLELVVYQQPNRNMQRIREYQLAYIYKSLQENVIKNSIALLSVEVLLRLLPEHAPMPELFGFVFDYYLALDKLSITAIANFPLFFIIHCSRELGYELKGHYSQGTPNLNLQEGSFTKEAPVSAPFISDEDTRALSQILRVKGLVESESVQMNADMRLRLIDWYIMFLQRHSEHMGNIKSLSVLHAILH